VSAVLNIGERFLSAAEIAKRQGVSSMTVRRWIVSGRLPAIFTGFAYRVPESGYAAFLESCRRLAPAPLSVEIRKRAIEAQREFSGSVRRFRDSVCGVRRGAR